MAIGKTNVSSVQKKNVNKTVENKLNVIWAENKSFEHVLSLDKSNERVWALC